MKNAIQWFDAPRMLVILIFVIVTSAAQPVVSAMAPPSAESLMSDAAVQTAKSSRQNRSGSLRRILV